jgi:tetrahydromethanopterin S-methyltransferase subunit H
MLSFSKEQAIFDIAGARFGGQPGETPTVLVGTVFYGKQFKNLDASAFEAVRGLVEDQEEFSGMTGNPGVVDIFIDGPDFAERIDAVADVCDGPISLDVPEVELWPDVLTHVDDAGLLGRTIGNSLNMGLTDGTIDAFREHTPAASILLGFDPSDMSADGRVSMIRDGGRYLETGLLELADQLGTAPLLDTAATPFDHMAGETVRAIPVLKNKFGLPVGCAIHNTVESWLWMRDYRKVHGNTFKICDMGANVLPMAFGADFLVYGPMDNARYIFPLTGMIDKMISEGAEDYFGVAPPEGHPRRLMP